MIAIVLLLVVVGVASQYRARWRAEVIALHLTGKIPDIDFGELVTFMMPGSDQSLERLVSTRNPHAVIRNFRTSAADLAAGGALYLSRCADCHGADGSGAIGPSLRVATHKVGASDWALYRAISLGIPGTAMRPNALEPQQLWQVVGFLRSIEAQPGESTASQRSQLDAARAVNASYEQIAEAKQPSQDWLTYSGSYSSIRHSALEQITPANVGHLSVSWIHQFDTNSGTIQASPIVRQGVMYLTLQPGRVIALDAATGRQIWEFDWKASTDGVDPDPDFVAPTRGVSILDDRIFFGTDDARLIALSAATGKLLWQARVGPPDKHYISSPPLVLKGLVVTGAASRNGGRGFIAAYDPQTGTERWRFTSVPAKGEPGNETWADDSWQKGGGPTWLTGSYDTDEDLIFWGVGNPMPDYDAHLRKGDNLYTNSIVALKGSTGKLVWHFQFTPADERDWDSCQIPVLIERVTDGKPQKLVLWANRNGFYYVLDRLTGKLLASEAFVHQTWTAGLDDRGRPKPPVGEARADRGAVVFPGNVGGTNWWSPSYAPALNLMFIPALEQGMVFFASAASTPSAANRPFYTAIRAVDATTGKQVWQHASAPRLSENYTGGLLSSKTGLLFGSDFGRFFALDARNGEELWSLETGGRVSSAPITYSIGGQQFVTVASGRDLMTFTLPAAHRASNATLVTAAH